jgi:predicted ATPase/DNA-binding CsgD family transcriptional regulator
MIKQDHSPLVEPLTEREQDVLDLLLLGKTNREIAETLFLSINTVKWYNRQIYTKLGVENRNQAVKRSQELGLVVPDKASPSPFYLPVPTTPLIGRNQDLPVLKDLLLKNDARIITITGLGGMGKTRLALELAHHVQDRFADQAAFINLAPLQKAESIVPTIAQSLHFTFQSGKRGAKVQLLDYLREKNLLLILDNFEHLLAGASLLIEIIENAPRVKIIVTSRERLNLQGEQLYPLEGLTLSPFQTLEQAQHEPAVQLFQHYGRRIRPGFQLQPADLPALRQLLHLLQGHPLAIILAAAWLELLPVETITTEIQKNFDILQARYRDLPERQQNIRAVFETSWKRLNAPEQASFAALSIFHGGFTLDAAREVVSAVPRELLALAGRSLLVRADDGRFEVHELLRQFAAEHLTLSPGQEEVIRHQHSIYYMSLLEKQGIKLKGAQAESCLLEIESDFQNYYAAWVTAIEQEAFALIGRAAFSLARFCYRTGRYEEGLALFHRSIKVLRPHISQSIAVDPFALTCAIRLLTFQCALHYEMGVFQQAKALGEEALSLLERKELNSIDIRQERGLALLHLSRVYTWQDRTREAEVLLHESVALFDGFDPWAEAQSLQVLAHIAMRRAKFKQAVQHVQLAVDLFAELEDKYEEARANVALGYDLFWTGKEEGEHKIRDSIGTFQKIGDKAAAATAMTFLGETLAYRGEFEEARTVTATSAAAHAYLGRRDFVAMSHIRWCFSVLHLGDYAGVFAQIPSILEIARDNNGEMNISRAMFLSGCAWLARGDTTKAREALEESAGRLRSIGSWDYLSETLVVLSTLFSIEAEHVAAKKALREALEIAINLETPMYKANVLTAAAMLALLEEDIERAVEYYALATSHPFVANSRWFADMIGRPIAAAAAILPSDTVATAQERGRSLHLSQTAESLLQEISGLNSA